MITCSHCNKQFTVDEVYKAIAKLFLAQPLDEHPKLFFGFRQGIVDAMCDLDLSKMADERKREKNKE